MKDTSLAHIVLIIVVIHVDYCTGQPSRGLLRVFSEDFKAGRLDPNSGEISCVATVVMPNTTCNWILGKGTRGQNSAIFYENQTFIFVAQENCDGNIGRTAIMLSMGPWCSAAATPPEVRAVALAYLEQAQTDLENLCMAWDHTCNIVMLAPSQQQSQFSVNQVSEYDGAQRFQPMYTVQSGWKKVNGVGALDFGKFRTSWMAPHSNDQEWNCGNECLFYTIEEQQQSQQQQQSRQQQQQQQQVEEQEVAEQLPRYLIGRAYRSGIVKLNITDSVQLQTLSWNPWSYYSTNQFLGIGQCCSDSWCNVNCTNYGNNLVLVLFTPSTATIEILSEIGEFDADTIRLGVEFTPAPYFKNFFGAYVIHKNTVLTYALDVNNGVVMGALLVGQSPPIGDSEFKLSMWANAGFN